jgi:ADP-ribosylglycohydrolase
MEDRFLGCMMGLAVGDALGAQVEFMAPGSFPPVAEMAGGGPHGLRPGEWTDDTSLALCLAESLLEADGFNPEDQMARYLRWYREGYLSSNGRCFDIGNATRAALERYAAGGGCMMPRTDLLTAGNGSLMRLAPVALYFFSDLGSAVGVAGESSLTTHSADEAVDACRYFAGLLVGALQGEHKGDLLRPLFMPVSEKEMGRPLGPSIQAVALGSFKQKEPPAIRGTGHVVECLEAALWAFHRSSSFEEGCRLAVNLGEDADTTGAVYGQLAGAYYGLKGIPTRWRQAVAKPGLILDMGRRLYEASLKVKPIGR